MGHRSNKDTWKRALNFSAALLLVLLTIFTSCTSRNYLKLSTDKGLEKTLNVNKANTSQFSCAKLLDEVFITQNAKVNAPVFYAVFILLGIGLLSIRNQFSFSPIEILASDKQTPLYILYKKMKILG